MTDSFREFELQLDAEWARTQQDMRAVVVHIGNYVAEQLIKRSPVRSGRFVANWNASISTPDVHVALKPYPGRSITLARLKSKVAAFQYLTTWPLIYFTEWLPYASRLEDGYSNQAPQGVAAITIANAGVKFRNTEV